jgi:glycopeptide antibiotics resistance protein
MIVSSRFFVGICGGLIKMILYLVEKLIGAGVTLPGVLLFLYYTDRNRFKKKWFWAVLFVVYMNAMFCVVGIPSAQFVRWNPEINWIPFRDFSSENIVGMSLNILMFIPFGAFLPIYFGRFWKMSTTVLAGAFMSFTIEVLQLFTFRLTDIDDLIMNTLGTLLGYGIGAIIVHKQKERLVDHDVMKLIAIIGICMLVVVFVNEPLVMAVLAN